MGFVHTDYLCFVLKQKWGYSSKLGEWLSGGAYHPRMTDDDR